MTREETIDIFEHNWTRLVNPNYTEEELNKAFGIALEALEQISHLKGRPCEVCEYHTENGCSKWECVFKGV